jgi:hypothetical protein
MTPTPTPTRVPTAEPLSPTATLIPATVFPTSTAVSTPIFYTVTPTPASKESAPVEKALTEKDRADYLRHAETIDNLLRSTLNPDFYDAITTPVQTKSGEAITSNTDLAITRALAEKRILLGATKQSDKDRIIQGILKDRILANIEGFEYPFNSVLINDLDNPLLKTYLSQGVINLDIQTKLDIDQSKDPGSIIGRDGELLGFSVKTTPSQIDEPISFEDVVGYSNQFVKTGKDLSLTDWQRGYLSESTDGRYLRIPVARLTTESGNFIVTTSVDLVNGGVTVDAILKSILLGSATVNADTFETDSQD